MPINVKVTVRIPQFDKTVEDSTVTTGNLNELYDILRRQFGQWAEITLTILPILPKD